MGRKKSYETLEAENKELKARLEEAEGMLRAIRSREVDALVVEGPEGPQVYSLEGAEKPYRTFVECMNEGSVTLTPDGTILHCNGQFAGILGKRLEQVIGSSFLDLVEPEGRDAFAAMVRECSPDGCKSEFQLLGSRRRKVSVRVSAKPLPESAIVCLVIMDITGLKAAQEALRISNEELENRVKERTTRLQTELAERVKAEGALRESEARHRALFENSLDAIFLTEPNGRILAANPAACAMFGMTREELTGLKRERLTVDPRVDDLVAERARVGYARGEGTFIRNGGTEFPVWLSSVTMEGGARAFVMMNDITERKEAEEVLKRDRAELELRVRERTAELKHQAELLDLAHDAIILWEPEGAISFWNSGAERTYGWRKEEALGRVTHDLLMTRFPIPLDEIMEIAEREGNWEGELVHRGKDGAEIVVLSRWGLQRNHGRSVEVMEVNRDITGRKQAEEALRSMGAYNRSLIEASPDPFVTISPEGKISDVNIATEEITGYPREILIGTDFSDYFTDPEKARSGYRIAFEEGVVRDYALEILHRDGRATPVLYNASVYRDESGEILGVFAAARDITERRQAELALLESEERYRTAIESASDGIALARENEHVYVNARFAEIFGYSSPDEITGKPLSLTVHPDDLEMVLGFNKARQRGDEAPSRYEFKGVKKDGTPRFIEVSAGRMNYRGEPLSLVYVRDVTEYKNLEERLRQAQKMEAIGTLAGGIAHDFNNILAGVIGFAEMVLEDMPPDDPSHRRLKLVLKAGQRGRDLVRQILTFSRQNEQESKEVAVTKVVEDALNLLRPAVPSYIEIRTRIEGTHDTVIADPVQIHQVFMNLCTNAAYAMRNKGGVLDVSLAEAAIAEEEVSSYPDLKPGHYVKLSVSDTGCGIAPDVIGKIFDPFFTTKGPGEGTGLGLSVAHGIVKNHGGIITVYSEPGCGTAFHVYLPKAEAGPVAETGAMPNPMGGPERILFVDDEEMLVEMNHQRLESLGYRVVTSMSSVEAVDIFRADPTGFDLVITDYTMPHLTGLDLAAALLQIRADIPIILTSGLNERVMPEHPARPGIRAFIAKTAGRRELAELIREVLSK